MISGNRTEKVDTGIYVYKGGVNTGILVYGDKAILVDCCDSLSENILREIGVDHIEYVFCTQHRRTHSSGTGYWAEHGAQIMVPDQEKGLFDDVEQYWKNSSNRWHLYHFRPSNQVLRRSVPVSNTLVEGDIIQWRGFTITAYETPGPTDGSMSYLVERDGKRYLFSGDLVFDDGRMPELYLYQKSENGLMDYHGFMGARIQLTQSLNKIKNLKDSIMIPSQGGVVYTPHIVIDQLLVRLDGFMKNYASISAVNFYFPNLFAHEAYKAAAMKPAPTCQFPDYIRILSDTTMALISKSGSALLIDCGSHRALDAVDNAVKSGIIKHVDACWVTHYHDDHTDYLQDLKEKYQCPVITTPSVASVITQPDAWLLPCISDRGVKAETVDHDWQWYEFHLTPYEFPGQTFYGAGLLVEGCGLKIFFGGDSFAPTGIDDYCAGNRNMLGSGRGYRYCLDIIKECMPDMIINQHQQNGFAYSARQIEYMESMLKAREKLVQDLCLWRNPNFALDEWWVRTFPYSLKCSSGSTFDARVEFTNYDTKLAEFQVVPVLPEGWKYIKENNVEKAAPSSCGKVYQGGHSDTYVSYKFYVPSDAAEGMYVIPFRITWNGTYLGQFRHMLVEVVSTTECEDVPNKIIWNAHK